MPSTAERPAAAGPSRGGIVAELATAFMFMTRLPAGTLGSGDPAVLSRATRWFPLVGLVVGALLAAAFALLCLALPVGVAAVGTLALGVLLTGAFHEDGLADVADSAGAFDVDRKLEIMRDSRVGTYGACALVLLLLGRHQLLVAAGAGLAALALPAAHVASRWATVWLMARFEYARPEAANRVVAEGVDGRRLAEATLVAGACLGLVAALVAAFASAPVAPWPAALLAAVVAAPLVAELAGRHFRRVFGGVTGDCLGAANQLVELAVSVAVVALVVGPS